MTLEDETGPIELRPHHLKRFFYDWMVTSDRDIEDILEKEGYDKTVVMNIYLIREKLFRYDSPIIIVPAEEDSICQGCNKLKDKAPKCIEPDHQRDYYMENLKKLFKEPSLSLGGVYIPSKLAKGVMDTLEELANWSLRDEDKLGKIVKKITAYKIRYEQLTEESQ